ncbi:MAG: hypothetical protein LH629_00735 [Ignavibacteria bacterium]|nr:hypothetical protein [Ignavibacteria bacterium]
MVKSKAIEIIKKLSEDEKLSLMDFLNSPFFNEKTKISELYNLILKNIERLDYEESSEEIIFAGLFKVKEFSYSFLRNLMSELFQLCETFLIVNVQKNNSYSDINSAMILLRQYNTLTLDNLFISKYKKFLIDFKKSEIDDSYFDSIAKLYSENIAFDLFRSQMENVPLKLIDRSEYHLCCITQLLETNMNDLTVNLKAFNLNLENEFIIEFVKNLDIENFLLTLDKHENHLKDEIEIRLRLILLNKNNENTKNYFKLKDLVLKNVSKYNNAERFNVFIKLKNYCAVRIFEFDKDFYKEKYILGKTETEYVKYNRDGVGPLYINVYIEVINFALKMNDIKFAEHYIKFFTEELELNKRESLFNLASAIVNFSKCNFEKVLEHISKVDTFNNLIKNTSKMLYVKTYYELNLLESGFSALDSYIHYIKNNKNYTSNRKKMLIVEYDLLLKLYKIKSSQTKNTALDLEIMKIDLNKSGVFFTEWYIEKINELLKTIK